MSGIGDFGIEGIPVILDPTEYEVWDMLNFSEGFTSYAILNHTMTVGYKCSNLSQFTANEKINYYLNEYINTDPNGDIDNDGIGNTYDNCVEILNPEQLDIDADLIGDECDYCNSIIGNSNNDNVVNIITSGLNDFNDWTSTEISICEFENSDTNYDSIINVLDIIAIINIILGEFYINNHCNIAN